MIETFPLPKGKTGAVCDIVQPQLARIVDGDTYWAYVQGLFRAIHYVELRLDGWDTPEKQGPLTNVYERMRATAATTFAAGWWSTHPKVQIATQADPEKYGRWLADVWSDGSQLGQELADRGLAIPYFGRGQRWRDVYGQPGG